MFSLINQKKPRNPGWAALAFLGQVFVSTIGSLALSYPFWLEAENSLRLSGQPGHAWAHLLISPIAGFALASLILVFWPSAWSSGRFVWLAGGLWALETVVEIFSFWSLEEGLDLLGSVGIGLLLPLGTVGYSCSMVVFGRWAKARCEE